MCKWSDIKLAMELNRAKKQQHYLEVKRGRTAELQLAADEADKLMDGRRNKNMKEVSS